MRSLTAKARLHNACRRRAHNVHRARLRAYRIINKNKEMKEHYITRCQLGYKLRSGWREIEFPTKWEAEKYAEEYRKSGRTAYVTVRGGNIRSTLTRMR